MQINRRTVLGGGAIFTGVSASASATVTAKGGEKKHTKALSALAGYVDQHRTDWGLPGMTVSVVDDSGFSGFVMSGLADIDRNIAVGPDHLFQVGSITKMMTALAAWSLIDEGKLSPDTRLSDLLPELSVRGGETITVKHLLDHTSGLPRGAPIILDGGLWTGSEPGAHWAYCNLGYKLAGMIVAKADGRLFPEAVEARVLRPLGMNNSIGALRAVDRNRYAQGYQPALLDRPAMRPGERREAPWVDYDGASGCVGATASDMALFLKFLIGVSKGKGGPVFSDEAAARFLADPADAPGWASDAKYGNGVAQITADDRAYLHHTGGMVSFSSSLHLDREAGVAAFASANVHYATNYRPRDVTLHACQLLQAAQDNAPAPAPAPAPTRPIVNQPARYNSTFTSQQGDRFDIISDGDQLKLQRQETTTKMQMIGDEHFACEDEKFHITGLQFEFENDKPIRAWAGGVEYLTDPATGYMPPPEPELRALEGRYDRDDRWALPIRIFARGDKLVMKNANYVSTLTQLDNGDWRASEHEWWPDWVRFDGLINGKTERLLISGVPYLRRFS
ncbi:serine hydrolase domain-containing protein [Hyphococcus sp.]|uniref:serine hydrolase domain-containing protein n=1 Tax=Hyphococcus sp. TaxID=2038636 RepID=UPI003CCB9444